MSLSSVLNLFSQHPVERVAKLLYRDHMELLGSRRTMQLSKRVNLWKHGHLHRLRETLWRERAEDLLAAAPHAGHAAPDVRLDDGYFIDTSGSLPGLSELLEAGERIIRGHGKKLEDVKGRSFFTPLVSQAELRKHPAILDFVLSAPVLRIVCDYLGFVPVLSRTMPEGVRVIESWAGYKPQPPGAYEASQLYHRDHHDTQMIYVIVCLRDVTPDAGPFTFLSASRSAKVTKRLRYGDRGVPWGMSDGAIYSVADPKEAVPLAYPAGTVLFFDSQKCFHYGSRDAVTPRYLAMYAFTSVARGDLTEEYMKPMIYEKADPSTIERLVLQRGFAPREIAARRPALLSPVSG